MVKAIATIQKLDNNFKIVLPINVLEAAFLSKSRAFRFARRFVERLA